MDNDEKFTAADDAVNEEIAEYYKNNKSTDKEQKTPQKQKYKFDFNIEDVLNEEIYEFDVKKEQDIFLFCSMCIFIATLILYGSFAFGTSRTIDNAKLEETKEKFRRIDEDYINAVKENKELIAEIDELNILSAQSKEKSLGLEDYESTKTTLKKRLSDAENRYKKANDELYELNQRLLQMSQTTGSLTLTPGVYTVGTNIPEGTYDVLGNGSLLASTTAHESVINERLNGNNPIKVTFENGYTVKINCNVAFNITD